MHPNNPNGSHRRFPMHAAPPDPVALKMAQLRRAAIAAVTEEDIAALMEVMLDKATSGDVAAARLVLAYRFGHPGGRRDPGRSS
jgi:hypothetical protein